MAIMSMFEGKSPFQTVDDEASQLLPHCCSGKHTRPYAFSLLKEHFFFNFSISSPWFRLMFLVNVMLTQKSGLKQCTFVSNLGRIMK